MTRFCIICGKILIGRQSILCSNKECHRERRNVYDYRYCQNHPGKILESSLKYRQNNREKLNEKTRIYRQDNPEKIKESKRKWSQNNSEKVKRHNHKYYQNNLEKARKHNHKYYRFSRGLLEDADLSKESSLERIMRDWLQKNNIEFIPQYFINLENSTWTWVDFYIPELNVCLYVDGGYHHLLPNAKKRDENQNRILPQMGYKVIRMTETEILKGNRCWKWIK